MGEPSTEERKSREKLSDPSGEPCIYPGANHSGTEHRDPAPALLSAAWTVPFPSGALDRL